MSAIIVSEMSRWDSNGDTHASKIVLLSLNSYHYCVLIIIVAELSQAYQIK